MVTIVLTATNSKLPSHYHSSNISVENEQYSKSKLFQRYNHKLNGTDNIDIEFCKEDKKCQNLLKLDRGLSYKNKRVTNVHVYFNIRDSNHKNPLLLVVLFENLEESYLNNKYYTRSCFETKLNRTQFVNLVNFSKYEDESSILQDLLTENDTLAEPLTYQIEKIKGDNTDDGFYNNKKIKVTDDSSSIQFLKTPGFKKYKHEPQGSNKTKNIHVTYNKDLLIGEGLTSIDDIQNKKYECINVYFSDNVNEPLLLEFCNKKSTPTTNEYYYHIRVDNGALIWKKLNKGDNVLGIQYLSSSEIYSQLVGQSVTKFTGLLNKLKSNLPKIIIFMIDYKQNEYVLSNIKSVFADSTKYILINQNIKVTDMTKSEGICVDKYGFRVYQHDFTSSAEQIKGEEKAQLKFIIPKSTDTKYNEITLFNNQRTSNQDVEVLEYKSSNNKFFVYFYGSDPRPLLLGYGSKAYKPKDKHNYTSNWIKVENITSFVCQDSTKNNELLNALFEVVGILNSVNLHNEREYTVQNFKTNEIKIKVSKTDLTCYYKYEYKHMNNIYKLGNIGYNANRKAGTLTYNRSETNSLLNSVATYYYNKDIKREFPLLVELQFDGDDKKLYYKLSKINTNYQWALDVNFNEGNLLSELFTLNRNFNMSKNPKEEDCNPSNSSAIAGGVSTTVILGGGGVAGGVLYYKYPQQVLSLISKLIPR